MSGPVSTKTESAHSGKIGESASLTRQSRVGHGLSGDLLALQRAAGNQVVEQLIASELSRGCDGQPLDPSSRHSMERQFGRDFGQVRVHADGPAATATSALSAAAFTHGSDIYFAPGRYQPGTQRGRMLLAHELSHVLQQAGGTHTNSLGYGAEVEATTAAARVARGFQTSVTESVPVGVQRQTVEEEKAQAQKASPQEGREQETGSGVGVGFQAWNVFSAHLDVPPVNLGPFFYTGFSVEAEINPQIGSFRSKSAQEGKAPTQIRVGKLFESGKEGKAFGVQAEIEHEFEQKVKLLGAEFTPVAKGGGKLSSEGAEAGIEGKLAGQNISTGLKFTFLETKWNKEESENQVKGPTLTWFVELFAEPDLELLSKLGVTIPQSLKNLDAELEIKVTYGFEFKPNYAWWGPRIAEAGRAARLALSAGRALVFTETGELTGVGAGGLIGGIVVAYVAWVGFGLIEIELATQKGRRESAMAAFFDGYAEMLTLVTGPFAFQAGLTPESPLLAMPWKETLKEYLEAYIRGDIKLLSKSPVYRAGQAAVAQDVYKYISAAVARGEDARASWLSVAARLRARFGESESKRSSSIRNALAAQAASDSSLVGIPFE